MPLSVRAGRNVNFSASPRQVVASKAHPAHMRRRSWRVFFGYGRHERNRKETFPLINFLQSHSYRQAYMGTTNPTAEIIIICITYIPNLLWIVGTMFLPSLRLYFRRHLYVRKKFAEIICSSEKGMPILGVQCLRNTIMVSTNLGNISIVMGTFFLAFILNSGSVGLVDSTAGSDPLCWVYEGTNTPVISSTIKSTLGFAICFVAFFLLHHCSKVTMHASYLSLNSALPQEIYRVTASFFGYGGTSLPLATDDPVMEIAEGSPDLLRGTDVTINNENPESLPAKRKKRFEESLITGHRFFVFGFHVLYLFIPTAIWVMGPIALLVSGMLTLSGAIYSDVGPHFPTDDELLLADQESQSGSKRD